MVISQFVLLKQSQLKKKKMLEMHSVIFTQLLLFQKVAVPVSLSSCNNYTEYLPDYNSNYSFHFLRISESLCLFLSCSYSENYRITWEKKKQKKTEERPNSYSRSQQITGILPLLCLLYIGMKGNEEAHSAALKVRGSTHGPTAFPPP